MLKRDLFGFGSQRRSWRQEKGDQDDQDVKTTVQGAESLISGSVSSRRSAARLSGIPFLAPYISRYERSKQCANRL